MSPFAQLLVNLQLTPFIHTLVLQLILIGNSLGHILARPVAAAAHAVFPQTEAALKNADNQQLAARNKAL